MRNRLVVRVIVFRDRRDALLLCLWAKHDVLDVRYARVELVVDRDSSARIDLNTGVFEVEAFEAFIVWPVADGDEHNIGFELYKVPDYAPAGKREN